MKKRHKQKLVILSAAVFVLLNAPVLLLFNDAENSLGFPRIYVYIFSVWLCSSLLSFVIIKKFNE